MRDSDLFVFFDVFVLTERKSCLNSDADREMVIFYSSAISKSQAELMRDRESLASKSATLQAASAQRSLGARDSMHEDSRKP